MNLFWESKGMKLFTERFYLFKKQGLENAYNFSSHIKTEKKNMKTTHTTLVVTTHINIL